MDIVKDVAGGTVAVEVMVDGRVATVVDGNTVDDKDKIADEEPEGGESAALVPFWTTRNSNVKGVLCEVPLYATSSVCWPADKLPVLKRS